jgi:apolipoprotein D and lipocalin family protein
MKKYGLRALFLGLAISASVGAFAQERPRTIDPSRLYRGVWLEVARRPMWITDGCITGTTGYVYDPRSNQVHVRDACRKGSEETVLNGVAEILDPGVNSRLMVRYNPFLSVEYDIIDHAADYSWFIEASPTLDNVFIFTRKRPSSKELTTLVNRVRQLGYDTSNLEFPWGR